MPWPARSGSAVRRASGGGPERAGRRWGEPLAALVVPLALAAMVLGAGTFHHGVKAVSLFSGALLLLVCAWAGRGAFIDPLALGTVRARWWPALLPAFWLSIAVSWLASPVSRAGEAIVVFLLPAVWAAAGVGRLVGRAAGTRVALAGCTVVGVAVSVWGLILQPLHEQGRAAMPIGHHNQLALVLVALLPAAALGAWRLLGPDRPRLRWSAAVLVVAVLVWTLAATGSFSGLLALLVQVAAVAAWLLWRSRGRRWVARIAACAALLAALALAVTWSGSRLDVPGPLQRLGSVLRLEDPSLLSRRTYAAAAFDGFAERPILGWGPGATSWTLARHWRPAPGVHPPGEVVTDAHSLVAQAPYELGIAGSFLLLLLAVRYGWLRLGELVRALREPTDAARAAEASNASESVEVALHGPDAEPGQRVRDPELLATALLGLLGAGVCLGFGVFAVVTAVPAALILNLGLVAAARGSASAPTFVAGRWLPRARIVVVCWLGVGLVWSFERAWAARSYERAATAVQVGTAQADAAAVGGGGADLPPEAPAGLSRAVALDPAFPLYRARLDPWSAARSADGLAPLWLQAGVDGDIDAKRRREALERACDLDPLSALAPFELMRLEREQGVAATDPRVAARAARAIVAEPLLLAAVAFEGDPDLRAEVHRRVQAWPGLPEGWLAAFEELWFQLDWSNGYEGPPPDVLSVDADSRPAVSFSLFAFRRVPWPHSIGAVALRSHRLDAIAAHELPAATRLPQTAPDPFWIGRCGLSEVRLP